MANLEYSTIQFKVENEKSVKLESFDKFVGSITCFTQAYHPIS